MKPLVIHRGAAPDKPLDRWFPPSPECPHWRWGFTAKGWTNNEHAIEWLKEVFIPQSRRGRDPDDSSYWRLLIVDGHGSHTQGEFIFECLINQVLVVYLLPHTSHLSQPCDLGPFAHLKSYYSKNLKSFIALGDTQVTRARFNVLYHRTRQEGLTAQYILAGWRRSGLYPLDARKVLEKPEVARYRATTPDLAPPQSRLTLTPQDDYEYERIQETLNAKLTRSGRRLQKQLSHAYFRESSARKLLSFEVSCAGFGNTKERSRSGVSVKISRAMRWIALSPKEIWVLCLPSRGNRSTQPRSAGISGGRRSSGRHQNLPR